MEERTKNPPWQSLVGLVLGGMATQVVGLAARLKLPDAIGDGERGADDLAAEYGMRENAMLRLLRALVALEVLTEASPGRFGVAQVGELLRADRPGSMYALARMITEPAMLSAWQNLEFSLRTGSPAFEETFKTDFFGYLADHPELSRLYNAAMSQGTLSVAEAVVKGYDFSGFETIVDVGGGDGTLISAVLRAHPGLRGVVYDSAAGASAAKQTLDRAGVAERCAVEAGDFFAGVPGGADLYLLKSIVHGWDDDRAGTILRHCGQSVAPHGRILMIEHVLPDEVPPNANPFTYLNDLNLLVNGHGLERTRADFERLCASGGLTLTGIEPLPPTGFCWIEARPG
ncbi:methyltransferase [Streptosporangium sp. NPDC000509]|uniref:methyltransferase n=1 Tax=Streptosporangium sp. NPDC000509 TaxID=3366186 RepID=UPI00369D7810